MTDVYININSIDNFNKVKPISPKGRRCYRVHLSDAKVDIALQSVTPYVLIPKTSLKEKIFGKRFVILRVKDQNLKEGYLKVNQESLRKHLGIDKKSFYQELKKHKDRDMTQFIEARIRKTSQSKSISLTEISEKPSQKVPQLKTAEDKTAFAPPQGAFDQANKIKKNAPTQEELQAKLTQLRNTREGKQARKLEQQFKDGRNSLPYDELVITDKQQILDEVKINPNCMANAHEDLKKDEKFAKEVLAINGLVLGDFHESIKGKKEICRLALASSNGIALRECSSDLRKDKEFCKEALTYNALAFAFIDSELKKDKEAILEFLEVRSGLYQMLSFELKQDEEVASKAFERAGYMLKLAPYSIKMNKKCVKIAVSDYGRALQYADKQFRNDRDVVLAAVRNDGDAIKFADDELQKDSEVKEAALLQIQNAKDRRKF